MSIKFVSLLTLFVILQHSVTCSYLLGAQRPGSEEDVKIYESRHLLNDIDKLNAVKKELSRRAEVESVYKELKSLDLHNNKRQIRNTPEPAVRRLKMTPPPNLPEGIYRLDRTPLPPSDSQRRPTPGYPYNLVDHPLRQTPRPLRQTPQPYVRPERNPIQLGEPEAYEQELLAERMRKNRWGRMYRKRATPGRKVNEENPSDEDDPLPYVSVGFITRARKPPRGWFEELEEP